MLDNRSLSLLSIINTQCLSSGYTVFDLSELVYFMPKDFNASEQEINMILKSLYDREYISVKYLDDVKVCLCPMPKGRLVFEQRIDSKIERSKTSKKVVISSMLGGFLGSGIIMATFLIIFALLGGFHA